MAKKQRPVKVKEVLSALDDIELWIKDIRDLLQKMGPNTNVGKMKVDADSHPRYDDGCPPPK